MHHRDPCTQNQHINLGTVSVGIREGSDSYGTRLHRDFGSLQEHELPRTSEVVRHHPDAGTQAWRNLNVKTIQCASPSWTRCSLAHDQAILWSKAKVRFYSDTVLCLGK